MALLSEALTQVLLVSLAAGMSTGIGGLPIFFSQFISHKLYDGMVALAAGVMIGASMFTLVIPGLTIEGGTLDILGLSLGNMSQVMIGILIGGAFLLFLDRYLVHNHFQLSDTEADDVDKYRKQASLIGGSITLHNVPEGLSVGIAFGSGLEGLGLTTAIAIGVQNIPDGFAFAVPADKAGIPKWKNMLLTTGSGGIPEPIAALLGFGLVQLVTDIFPIAAGFAAGAMMAVVFKEMIPESHGHGYTISSTFMFLIGFVIMLYIDNTFTV